MLRKIYPFSVLYQMHDDVIKLKEENEKLKEKLASFIEKALVLESDVKEYKTQLNESDKKIRQLQEKLKKKEDLFQNQLKEIHTEAQQQEARVKEHMAEKIKKESEAAEQSNQRLREMINKNINEKYVSLYRRADYLYYKGLSPEQYESVLKEWFFEKTGMALNLDNPQTYNEKIQWLKLYDRNPQISRLADKYEVRSYVVATIGEKYLIPLLGAYDNENQIDWDRLPRQFVIKTNHGCGFNIIVVDKDKENFEQDKRKLHEWLHTDFSFKNGFELQYSKIPRKLIIEEYIENENQDLYDYKVFCFNGKAKYIMFLSDRKEKLKMQFYDLNWELQPFVYSYERKNEPIERPDNLEELITISEKLAEGFCQVRVDFYRLNSGEWKFGEMTFTSASGVGKWDPPEYDRILGDLIELPIN